MIKKSGKGKVKEGDKVIAFCDDRPYAFAGVCTGVSDDGISVKYADGDEGIADNGRAWKANTTQGGAVITKVPDGPVDRSKCTHFYKLNDQATVPDWTECVIL